jgi:general secretion pathway protein J
MTPPPTHRKAAPHGLTLIEIMIAMAITAIIGAMVAGAFQRTYAAKELADAQDEREGAARVALTRLARELSEAYLSDHYDRKHYRQPPTLLSGKDLGQRGELTFTTMSHQRLERDVKESDESLVSYTVDTDPDHRGELALYRREKAHLDDDPDRGGTQQVVCEHVVSFRVEYWDWQKQEWVREWVTTSPERSNILPTRVRLRLGLKMPNGEERVLETQARIAIVRPLTF